MQDPEMQEPGPIIAQPLTDAAFAPFGQLVALPKGGGRPSDFGAQLRFDHAATLQNARGDGAKPNLAVVQVAASVGPYRIDMMERHEFSSQAFVALDVARFLTIVRLCRRTGPRHQLQGGHVAFSADRPRACRSVFPADVGRRHARRLRNRRGRKRPHGYCAAARGRGLSPPFWQMKSAISATALPALICAKMKGRSPRILRASRSITSSDAPT